VEQECRFRRAPGESPFERQRNRHPGNEQKAGKHDVCDGHAVGVRRLNVQQPARRVFGLVQVVDEDHEQDIERPQHIDRKDPVR